MNVGIGLALLCAAITQLGFLCKHRGATQAPRVELRAPLRSARDLFRSKWFAIGMAIAAGAWILHVAALALAPLSRRPGRALDRRRDARGARRAAVRLPRRHAASGSA